MSSLFYDSNIGCFELLRSTTRTILWAIILDLETAIVKQKKHRIKQSKVHKRRATTKHWT